MHYWLGQGCDSFIHVSKVSSVSSCSTPARTITAVFFSASTYFVHFLALGFSSFPLQTHLRKTLSPATASMVAGLIPIAACATYFLLRFAESKGWTKYPQRTQFVAAVGVAIMQCVLGFRLQGLAEGHSFFGPAIDIALCLLLLGCLQSSVMTLLNHISIATMGSLAYTVRASGSAGYMVALMIMGAIGGDWFNIEKQHLFVGSCISVLHCLLALGSCFFVPEHPEVPALPKQNAPKTPSTTSQKLEWMGLLALVWLVAVCEMSYGLYSHEFLTNTYGEFGYFIFATAVGVEIAILLVIPIFPQLKKRLLFVGPLGWTILFIGCIASMFGMPALGFCGIALALNCPFQISANEHAHRMNPSVMGIASMTLAQSLGYVTAAILSSVCSRITILEQLLPTMPATLWILVLPLATLSLVLSVRKLARENASLDIDDLGQSSGMAGSGGIPSIEKSPSDFEGDFRTNHTSPDAEDVHIVVLDPLASRVSVVTQASTNAREFVSSHADAHTRTADEDASIDFTRQDSGRDRLSKVREIA